MCRKKFKFWLYLLLSILLIVMAFYTHRAWERYNPIDYWLVKYGFNEYVPSRSLPESHKVGMPEMIAHGGGEIDGIQYTNSREALLQSISLGYKFIEIDLKETIEGELFGAHSVREFREFTELADIGHFPVTNKQVRNAKIHGKYTPIFLRDIYEILKLHPDVYLVTDKTKAYKSIIEQFPLPEQLIVETFAISQYYRALKAVIWYPTFPCLGESKLREHKATLSVMSQDLWDRESGVRGWASESANTAIVLTSNDCHNIKLPKGTLMYTDRCLPK